MIKAGGWQIALPLLALSSCGESKPSKSAGNERVANAASSERTDSVIGAAARSHGALVGPTHFANGDHNNGLLQSIRAGMETKINFAGHFSTAYVSCGLACGSYWFVDRRTGAVFESPDEASVPEEIVFDLETRAGSDRLKVIYGPGDGVGDNCFVQEFRWSGNAFVKLTGKTKAPCPKQ